MRATWRTAKRWTWTRAAGRRCGRRARHRNDAVWFRQTNQVPETLNGYDLTGARIWFQFHADANGPMPEILYFNGRRVAMGDDLEPVVLFDQAQAGRQGDGGGEAAAHGGHEELSRARRCRSISARAGRIRKICARSFCRRRCWFLRWRRATRARWPR